MTLKSLIALTFLSLPLILEGKPPEKALHLRFIPLGEQPTWAKPEGHLLYEPNRAVTDRLPPSLISVLSAEDPEAFPLRLRSFSKTIRLPLKTETLLLRHHEKNAASIWFTQKAPSYAHSLGVLYQPKNAEDWKFPKTLFLKDDAESFPAGYCRFVNLSEELVIVQIGDRLKTPRPKVFGIRPGTTLLRPLKVGKNQLRVGYTDAEGATKWIWANLLTLEPGQRVQSFCYQTKDRKHRQKVLFHHAPESIPTLPAQR